MKLNKTIGRVATTLVATAMLASLASVPAFAVGDDGGNSGTTVTKLQTSGNTVTFKKVIDMSNATGAGIPTGNFTFTVGVPTSVGAGETEGEKADITSVSATSDGSSNELVGTITFAPNAFDAVGTYVYTLQEDDGENPDIDYHENDVYTLRVTVLNANSTNPDGESFVIGDVTLQGETDKTDTITNEYTTYDLTVTKAVTGAWGVQSDDFDFVVTIDADSIPDSVKSITLGNDLTDISTLKNSDGDYQVSFTLSGGANYTIQGLPSTATYEIEELNRDAAAGYTTAVKESDDTEAINGKIYSADMKDDNGTAKDITVNYTNTRDPGPATGIVMDIAPYALLVVIAAAGCFVFLRKRRED